MTVVRKSTAHPMRPSLPRVTARRRPSGWQRRRALRSPAAPDGAERDPPSPSAAQRARAALHDMVEDILRVRAHVPEGPEAPPSGGGTQLWRDFRDRAARAVRRTRVSPDVTVAELMAEVLGPEGDAATGRPRRASAATTTDLCTRHCRFLGRASAAGCAARPDDIVSLCPPDPLASPTLCFDVDELDDALGALRAQGDDGPLRALLRPVAREGRAVPPLDHPSVIEALEWQVRLAREVREAAAGGATVAPGSATIDAGDRLILTGLVLPTLAQRIMTTDTGRWAVGVFQRYTPQFVRRAMRTAGNALLFLLNTPWLNSLALMVTRVLRTCLCFYVFGLHDFDRDVVWAAIIGHADVRKHYPTLDFLLDVCFDLLECLRELAQFRPVACVQRLGQRVGLGFPVYVGKFVRSVVADILKLVGTLVGRLPVVGSLGEYAEGAGEGLDELQTLFGTQGAGNFTLAGAAGWFLFATTGRRIAIAKDHTAEFIATKSAVQVTQVVRNDLEEFFRASNQHRVLGIMLWMGRFISAARFVRWMDFASTLCPGAQPVFDSLAVAARWVGGSPMLHDVLVAVLRTP